MNWNQEEEEEYKLSLSRFEAMLKTNKVLFFDSEEFENIILHYFDNGKINLAKKALKLGLEQHPKSVGLKLVQVEILIYENKLDVAEKMLNDLYEIEPENEEIYIQKANIQSKKGNHSKAVELLEIALQYTDDYADVYSLIGMEYLFMDELEKAKESFIKCLNEDGEDYSSLYNVVYCFDFMEQHPEAIKFLKEFIDNNPYSEVAWHQLGRQYYAIKNYEEAVKAFDYAIVIDESFLGAYMEKGKALERLNRFDEAIKCYNQTLELDDPTAYAFLRIGKCYEKLDFKELAIKQYRRAITEDPLLEKAWLAIIDIYVIQNKLKQALNYVNKALDIDPENDNYWKRYATINYALEHYDLAFEGCRRAISIGCVDLGVYFMYADMSVSYEEVDEAIEALINILLVYPDNSEVEYRLAALLFTKKDIVNASFYFTNALINDFEGHSILSDHYPEVMKMPEVLDLVEKHRK